MLPNFSSETGDNHSNNTFWRSGNFEWLKKLFAPRQETIMRKYIRHPSNIPIDFQVETDPSTHVFSVKDVSEGGLCFKTDKPMKRGTKIHIHIPVAYQIAELADEAGNADATSELFEAEGVVAWCRKEEMGYAVGVQFADPHTRFGVRMVEQICHIEHYRHDVLQAQGRRLTREQAAREWVERYAAEFP